jgi:NH3-dependent NAD+ synthetase
MTHITPQRADSATFASYDSSAQAEVADAFLSFFGLQQVVAQRQKARIRQDLAYAFAAASGQRYLSALIFVWQAAR